MIMRKIRFFC